MMPRCAATKEMVAFKLVRSPFKAGRWSRRRRPTDVEVGDQPSELLDLAIAEVEALCADLIAAGMIERARER